MIAQCIYSISVLINVNSFDLLITRTRETYISKIFASAITVVDAADAITDNKA